MQMPDSLVLIRHGESESNFARTLYERGVPFPNEVDLMAVHTSERRLTRLGVRQANNAGHWLFQNWFDDGTPRNLQRFFVSPYIRAMETAACLDLQVGWQTDCRLVERNWGELDQLPYAERLERFADELASRKDYAFFWRPGNGETFQDVFNRLHSLKTRIRLSPARRVAMVCHGETMWVWRTLLERWTPHMLKDEMRGQTGKTSIHNCRIIEYTSIDGNGERHPRLVRVRLIDPCDPDNPERNQDWLPLVRPRWSDRDMLEYVNQFPRFLPEELAAE